MKGICLAFAMLPLTTLAAAEAPLTVVPHVDVRRYVGLWYEIAKYPNRFQKNCSLATAEYTLRPNGDVTVINRCTAADGKTKQVRGKAWVVDRETNAKLKVRFFWPFSGKYWVIDLGTNYEYAVVSEPKRKYLWILSRTERLPKEVLDGILERLKQRGFEPSKLEWSRG